MEKNTTELANTSYGLENNDQTIILSTNIYQSISS